MAGDPRLATDYQTWLWVPLDGVYPWLLSEVEAWKAHRWDADVALPERALFLVGERGVGKTWLLRHLAKDEPQVSALAAYLDLEERAYFSSAERYVEVMNDRVEQQLGDEGAVLLVDAVPPQTDEKLRMLEDTVLRPRATQRHALVIMALTHPMQVCWRTPAFQVGERWRLVPFGYGQTRKQLQQLKRAGLTVNGARPDAVQKASGGLPLLNYLLVTRDKEEALEALLGYSFSSVPIDERERVRSCLEAVCLLDSLEHTPIRKMMEIYHKHKPNAKEYPAHAVSILNLLRRHWLSQSAVDSPGRMVLVGSVRRAATELLMARDAGLYAELARAARTPSWRQV